jgi:hypothetical protein
MIERWDQLRGFPRKGALLHFYFARLHLHSHVFRGLRDAAVPTHFHDCAATAVSSAHSIIDLILSDADVREGLVGMPSYLLSMTAYTCMFLIKISMKYGAALADPDRAYDSIARLVVEFRTIPAGKWHLVRLMAGGLEKMLAQLKQRSNSVSSTPAIGGSAAGAGAGTGTAKMGRLATHALNGAPSSSSRGGSMGNGYGPESSTPAAFSAGGDGAGAAGMPEHGAFPPDWSDGAGSVPGLDGTMFFDYNMSFGLSPVVHFDPSALGMEGQIRGV